MAVAVLDVAAPALTTMPTTTLAFMVMAGSVPSVTHSPGAPPASGAEEAATLLPVRSSLSQSGNDKPVLVVAVSARFGVVRQRNCSVPPAPMTRFARRAPFH